MGLVVLVKIMSVFINFLLKNTNLVPKFRWSYLTGLTISRTLYVYIYYFFVCI